jgi:hypothetical protein
MKKVKIVPTELSYYLTPRPSMAALFGGIDLAGQPMSSYPCLPQSGRVYVIRRGDTDVYKIGHTTKTTTERLKSLQRGIEEKLTLVHEFETFHYWELEAWLHEKLAHNLAGFHGREWFCLPPSELERLKSLTVQQALLKPEPDLSKIKAAQLANPIAA